MELLVTICNEWRQRHVRVYQHPTDPEQVVTHGMWYDGSKENICVEPKAAFRFEVSQGKNIVTTN